MGSLEDEAIGRGKRRGGGDGKVMKGEGEGRRDSVMRRSK